MTCAESRRLMHLDRPGERTERETQAWLEHLKGCPACGAEAEASESVRSFEQRLREATVALPDVAVLRARILSATADAPSRHSHAVSRYRLAYAFTVAAAVIWFGTDQWRFRAAHADLHERSVRPASATIGPQIVYTINAAAAKQLTDHGAAIPPALTNNGALEVAQSTALHWLENTPSHLVRPLTRDPAQRAQITEALRILRSAVDVTIRYRSQGA